MLWKQKFYLWWLFCTCVTKCRCPYTWLFQTRALVWIWELPWKKAGIEELWKLADQWMSNFSIITASIIIPKNVQLRFICLISTHYVFQLLKSILTEESEVYLVGLISSDNTALYKEPWVPSVFIAFFGVFSPPGFYFSPTQWLQLIFNSHNSHKFTHLSRSWIYQLDMTKKCIVYLFPWTLFPVSMTTCFLCCRVSKEGH